MRSGLAGRRSEEYTGIVSLRFDLRLFTIIDKFLVLNGIYPRSKNDTINQGMRVLAEQILEVNPEIGEPTIEEAFDYVQLYGGANPGRQLLPSLSLRVQAERHQEIVTAQHTLSAEQRTALLDQTERAKQIVRAQRTSTTSAMPESLGIKTDKACPICPHHGKQAFLEIVDERLVCPNDPKNHNWGGAPPPERYKNVDGNTIVPTYTETEFAEKERSELAELDKCFDPNCSPKKEE